MKKYIRMISFAVFVLFQSSVLFSQEPVKNVKEECVSGNCVNGFGKAQYSDGGTYEGQFTNKLAQGKGKVVASDGSVYEGDFAKGKLTKLMSKTVQEGTFKEGKFVE